MKISVAEQAGFCFGVKRALKLINEYHRQGKKIQTFGPLIHNTPVLNDLAAKGVGQADSLAGSRSPATRPCASAPTASPATSNAACARKGVPTLDATCPLVKKGQKIIEQLGRDGQPGTDRGRQGPSRDRRRPQLRPQGEDHQLPGRGPGAATQPRDQRRGPDHAGHRFFQGGRRRADGQGRKAPRVQHRYARQPRNARRR